MRPDEVEVTVEQLVHVGDDDYTVARVSEDDRPPFVASGRSLAGVQPGERLLLGGEWGDHPRFGARLQVRRCERIAPSTVRAVALYLGSGLIRGVGPRLAHAIVSHFGEDTLKVIDTEPARLREVVNIGAVRQAQIVEAWAEQKAVAALMVALQGFGVSPLLAAKIYQTYGDEALHVLTTDPYQLVGRVRGIAFQSADRIALRSGVPEDSPQRVKAAVVDRIEAAAAGGGHCFVPLRALVAQVAALVEQDEPAIRQAIDALHADRRVVVEAAPADPSRLVVYGKQEHSREVALAGHLARLLRAPSTLRLRNYQEDDSLHEDQRAAVNLVLTSTVSVLTGGPGCGKSHTVAAIAATVRGMGGRVTLAAPTGKAAKRLSELTGLPAMTVHRMLAQQPEDDGALFQERAVEADLIVVDEASMLDLQLATRLASAVPSGSHLLLVGDSDQ
ncbi:MAG TPA: AAA family ATPase, partial [Nonomuraea sp.]|nr:AAA family ATPase [Nonomuraea sp.]